MFPSKELPLCCPCDTKANLLPVENGLICKSRDCPHGREENRFRYAMDIPILVSDLRCDTVCEPENTRSRIPGREGRLRGLKRRFFDGGKTTRINCGEFTRRVKALSESPRVLVIGSGEKGSGTEALWQEDAIEVHGVDIYASASVDAICDAHYLPLAGKHYDGVWIQAVLEHVVEPGRVVAEIHRVLRDNGIVYAETPFMQQVHEGAYDFTRFTVLGHRYLFREFRMIAMGGIGGPETVLAWSLRYFAWGLTRSRTVARIVGATFDILLRPFAHFMVKASLHDSPSETWFMGAKSGKTEVTHKELIALYKGQLRG